MTNQTLRSRIVRKTIRMGVPPSWFKYHWIEKDTMAGFMDRKGLSKEDDFFETIHETKQVQNRLPCNIDNRNDLPNDRGWWGYSFWDVPARTSGETFMATLPDCRIIPYIDDDDEFWVTILNSDDRSLELDQISYRPWHGKVLRSSAKAEHVERATWILERVYRNHSHWLTAHLPKLVLLKERDQLSEIILPEPDKRTPVMNSSFKMIGINPDDYRTFDSMRPLKIDQLTVLETDRFRPELLLPVRDAICSYYSEKQNRKIYISRAKALRRKLLNEDDIWPILESMGFEKVFMEDMSFSNQVLLMQQAAIVVAPHGAAITNIMFCQPGTHVLEIADLSFPNPNFYALASAMGHHYWVLNAEGFGNVHPLEKDLHIDPSDVRDTVNKIFSY